MRAFGHYAGLVQLRRHGSPRRGRLGVAALEFALAAPVLATLFVGALNTAEIYLTQLKLNAAVYAGASYAIVNKAQVSAAGGAALASAIATIVGSLNGNGWASGSVVINNGPSASFTGGAATPGGTAANADSFYCLGGSPGNWSWGTAQISSSVACATGGTTAGKFVTITASHTVTPMFLQLGFVSSALTQKVVVQVD